MTERISLRLVKLAATTLVAIGCLAVSAGAASATTTEVAYNNLNTVPSTVNGLPNEDTFSAYPGYFSSGGGFGGLVEFANTQGQLPKTLTTQLDVFACEHGTYLENCITLKPGKAFKMQWTVGIYRTTPNHEPRELVTTATATFKLHYRPTTNTSCPATSEGLGFGPNCDVGGLLQTVTFKHFSPVAPLPERGIILLTAAASPDVNVGLQSAYKEFSGGEFIAEPPVGAPAVGSDPLPEDAYVNGALNVGGWNGLQPVFEVTVN